MEGPHSTAQAHHGAKTASGPEHRHDGHLAKGVGLMGVGDRKRGNGVFFQDASTPLDKLGYQFQLDTAFKGLKNYN